MIGKHMIDYRRRLKFPALPGRERAAVSTSVRLPWNTQNRSGEAICEGE
jgi:hypothetical protein